MTNRKIFSKFGSFTINADSVGDSERVRVCCAQKTMHEIDLEYGIFGSLFRSGTIE